MLTHLHIKNFTGATASWSGTGCSGEKIDRWTEPMKCPFVDDSLRFTQKDGGRLYPWLRYSQCLALEAWDRLHNA